VWDNSEKKKFVDVAFLQPDESLFATIDENANAQLFFVKSKEQVATLPQRPVYTKHESSVVLRQGFVAHNHKLETFQILSHDARLWHGRRIPTSSRS
jgi:hypothetical protein